MSLVSFLLIALFFVLNLIIFTIYFSEFLLERGSWHKKGFLISFSGVCVGTVFALLFPSLPTVFGSLDIGVGLVWVTWILLTKHYCRTGWLYSAVATIIAIVQYIVIMAIAVNFCILFGVSLPTGLLLSFPCKPSASFVYSPTEPLVGTVITFEARAGDIDGSVSRLVWDFGDGNTGKGWVVKHVYAAAGTYKVVLCVTDNDGFTNEATASLTVSAP